MDCYPLDITLISADGLKKVNIFTKMNVYVLVSINGDLTTARKSTVDKDAGSNPRWNHHFRFELDEHTINHRSLVFLLKSDRTLGDRDIGEVSVRISDLFDKSTVPADSAATAVSPKIQPEEHVMEYLVRTKSGKSKGCLTFSFKFGEKYTRPFAPPPPDAAKAYSNFNEPVTAYPPPTGPSAQPGMMYPPYPHPAYAPPPPPTQGYAGYPPPQSGYTGYPPTGYPPYGGYQQAPPAYVQQQSQKNKMGGGGKLGLGLGAGLLGGLLVGDMIGDVGEMAAYDADDYEL